MTLPVGLALPTTPSCTRPSALAELARAAERLGYAHLWVSDHGLLPPGSHVPADHQLDPFASLAWLAAQTREIRLGTSALALPYRGAAATAKTLATIDWLSGGRLIVGVGAGWFGPSSPRLACRSTSAAAEPMRRLRLARAGRAAASSRVFRPARRSAAARSRSWSAAHTGGAEARGSARRRLAPAQPRRCLALRRRSPATAQRAADYGRPVGRVLARVFAGPGAQGPSGEC